jgi:uncharacterized membrane protein
MIVPRRSRNVFANSAVLMLALLMANCSFAIPIISQERADKRKAATGKPQSPNIALNFAIGLVLDLAAFSAFLYVARQGEDG